jgi:ribonuclease Z
MLGTGAASSSTWRKEAGILVRINGKGNILLDSGCGYSQLSRKFGVKTKSILKGLKCVWISHRHPDHHAGMLEVLIERQQVRQQS